ncbi:egg cell-secreted protein 1.3-like [Malania oleifera]|uniref:egg cell-secreted protein 1.3-like n=1 Tax=Malania oleifera TaxID=397392 RepID=UPI0025AE1EDC|nr:egg cell-secreted protein 1.3-like [Malania oleifera]
MASLNFLLLALVLVACSAAVPWAARPLNTESSSIPPLASRLMQLDNNYNSSSDDNNSYCWDSLFELHSCIGEVILFFLNGETYLGPTCCRAIHTVQLHCLPSMIDSLGFTPQESDILRGYCDASLSGHLHPPPPLPETFKPDVDVTQNLLS